MYKDDLLHINPNISQNKCCTEPDFGWPAIPYTSYY